MLAEIGVDQGRSASVLFESAKQTGSSLILVDSWESVLIDNYYKVKKLADLYPAVVTAIHREKSVDAAAHSDVELSLVHIDAHHYDDWPTSDCEAWLPKLKSGGVACFHYVGAGFLAVTRAVNDYCERWEDLGNWDSLAIRRKP